MKNDKIGQFIKKLREENGLTQEELASLIPISRQAVSKWERNITIPDVTTLTRLSKIFNVTINEILIGEFWDENNKEKINDLTLEMYKDNRRNKKFLKLLLGVITFLGMFFLAIYFINFYNKIYVYTIKAEGNTAIIKNGILVNTNEKIYFSLGNINLKKDHKIKQLKLYYKDKSNKNILISNSDSEELYFNDYNTYHKYFDYKDIKYIANNLYLEINYENEKEVLKLNLNKDFANSKIFLNKKNKINYHKSNDLRINNYAELKEKIEKKLSNKYDTLAIIPNIVYQNNILYLEEKNKNISKKWQFNLIKEKLSYTEYQGDNIIKKIIYEDDALCVKGPCLDVIKIEEEFWQKVYKYLE